MTNDFVYKICSSPVDFEDAKLLFREYVDSLPFDLSFQNFEKELERIDRQYGDPEGALILAYAQSTPVACVGLRKFENDIAELKRMYVRPAFRGRSIGVQLLQRSIDCAVLLGYKKIRLDTVKNMYTALSLYRGFGFLEIPAYRFNPMEDAVYMEKDLWLSSESL